jgi:hypothetical protein
MQVCILSDACTICVLSLAPRIKLTEENKRELAGDNQQDMEEEEEEEENEENEEEDEVGYY